MRFNHLRTPLLSLSLLVFLLLFRPITVNADPAMEEEYKVQSQAVIKAFAKELMGEFKQALKKGGPTEAIAACSAKAYAIANKISRRTGWMVRRVSLKTRNPSDRPDAYETEILQEFQSTATTKKQTEEVSQVVDIGGRKEFRYMKVIRIAPPCLKCHGPADKIAPEIKANLNKNYPHDRATGYKAGDVRGAFSVRMPLEE